MLAHIELCVGRTCASDDMVALAASIDYTVTQSKNRANETRVRDLSSHEDPFVTTADLADYWCVSRRQIHKQIEQGHLPAIRLGPRSLRVPTQDAIAFERRAAFEPREPTSERGHAADHSGSRSERADGHGGNRGER